ncbi:major capsid protein [Pseudomonas nicosulfuronedens]|uniref:major capsid protein n=1 Tax=Pseudomonas TaxID=286 RepID=UPI001E52CBF1|nr:MULTISPECIES: major capsid protein [Pseudomonas]MCE4073562.1 major capsid protein [Pseudomonas nitritireducens]MCE4082776.1 major capsid protein [Pseudomonas nitroreducens]MDH1011629.1 major capsid protein [Pseudomonas nicosulfuronedens]MDH1980381.1 major capsid protein [Pseudomonas nicosulfuronedens]MDH2029399.1 major capsid protein [Pseudomonas nicosulfuronedens]
MKALQKLNPVTALRNLCIAGTVTAVTSVPAFAASVIDTSAVEQAITDGKGDMSNIGGYIVGALVILAVAGLIYSMLRKA